MSKKPQEPISGSADQSEFDYARENADATPDSPKPAARSDKKGGKPAPDSPSASDESEFKYERKREN